LKSIFLCSISNVSSGGCGEDCGYCMQSAHHDTGAPKYRYKSVEQVVREAKFYRECGAAGFCLVTAGRSLDSAKCEYIAKLASEITRLDLGLHLIACNGRADRESLSYLRQNGVGSYNHNLETARSFFPQICTTHTWEERYETCQNAASVGLKICSGGIFGLGESAEQRREHLRALASLNVHTTPINFYIPHPGLRIQEPAMSREQALECVQLVRKSLPSARVMIAGGREVVFGADQRDLFACGIDAVVLGDYLTTKGNTPQNEAEKIKDYGFDIANTYVKEPNVAI